jgi:hypothetical protein
MDCSLPSNVVAAKFIPQAAEIQTISKHTQVRIWTGDNTGGTAA